DAGRSPRRHHRGGRSPRNPCRRGSPRRPGRPSRRPRQGTDRRLGGDPGTGARRRRTLDGQGAAGDRQAAPGLIRPMARLRAKDYDDKRAAILEQAAGLFATEGFAAASLSRLAAACETSKASLYHYYQSKEAILFDILD